MSSYAFAYQFERNDTRRLRLLRKKGAVHVRSQAWSDVPVVSLNTAPKPRKIVPTYAWLLIGAVVAGHLSVAWYATHHVSSKPLARKTEVAVELVRPPKPPEPQKIEPPKPTPPKPQVKRPTQVLPPIQQPVADHSNDTDAAIGEVVAVAPIASEPPAPAAPPPVTAPFGRAGYLNNPPPEYPPVAARQGWQGTVLLRVRVLANGKVEAVEVQQSSGRKVLDEEATRTVKQWSFTPSKRGDEAIDGWATVPIEFKLEQ